MMCLVCVLLLAVSLAPCARNEIDQHFCVSCASSETKQFQININRWHVLDSLVCWRLVLAASCKNTRFGLVAGLGFVSEDGKSETNLFVAGPRRKAARCIDRTRCRWGSLSRRWRSDPIRRSTRKRHQRPECSVCRQTTRSHPESRA